jgi:hypothetical protein
LSTPAISVYPGRCLAVCQIGMHTPFTSAARLPIILPLLTVALHYLIIERTTFKVVIFPMLTIYKVKYEEFFHGITLLDSGVFAVTCF